MKKILTVLLLPLLCSSTLKAQSLEIKDEIIDVKEHFKFKERIDLTKYYLSLIKDLKIDEIENLTIEKWDNREWYINHFKSASDSIKKYGVPLKPSIIKVVKSFAGNFKKQEFFVIEYYYNTKMYIEEESVGVSFYFTPAIGFHKVFSIQFIEPFDLSLFEE